MFGSESIARVNGIVGLIFLLCSFNFFLLCLCSVADTTTCSIFIQLTVLQFISIEHNANLCGKLKKKCFLNRTFIVQCIMLIRSVGLQYCATSRNVILCLCRISSGH